MLVTNKPSKLPTLEESLTEITQLIDKMEHSELTLEQSLNNFERGITLVKHCQKILDEAEQKVQILIQNNNQEELISYGDADKDEGSEANEKKGI
jgi:exodeoxyribonuclease VII small subunit